MFKQKRTLIIVVVGLIAVGGVLFLRQSRIFQKVIPSQKDECIEQDNACCKKDGICRQLNLLCEEGLEPEIKGCSPDCTPIAECVPKQGGLKIPNPASVFCQKQNGKIEIKKDEQGNQYSLCIFEDGSVCEEWALFRPVR